MPGQQRHQRGAQMDEARGDDRAGEQAWQELTHDAPRLPPRTFVVVDDVVADDLARARRAPRTLPRPSNRARTRSDPDGSGAPAATRPRHADETRRGDRQGPIAAIDLALGYLLVNRLDLGEGARHIHPLLTLHNKVPPVNCRSPASRDMLRRLLERLFSSHRAPNPVRTSSFLATLALRPCCFSPGTRGSRSKVRDVDSDQMNSESHRPECAEPLHAVHPRRLGAAPRDDAADVVGVGPEATARLERARVGEGGRRHLPAALPAAQPPGGGDAGAPRGHCEVPRHHEREAALHHRCRGQRGGGEEHDVAPAAGPARASGPTIRGSIS